VAFPLDRPLHAPRELSPGELHIWHGSLHLSSTVVSSLEPLLSADERVRAQKFLAPHARDSFVAARGILRRLLSAYTGIDAADLALSTGADGKPRLASRNPQSICFNLSHSHHMGLLAFARAHEVGVDIEHIRPDFDGPEIARQFFSPQEFAELSNLPEHARSSAFFRCWTRKEAYVKARGAGMGIPLDTFTVRFTSDREQLLRDEAGAPWTCYNLDFSEDFAAAVVAAGENWKLARCQWEASETALEGKVRD
jgi:4'-phosphopantetheinyl transferase